MSQVLPNSDLSFIKIAYGVAKQQSTDPSTKNGAIIVVSSDGQKFIKVAGANHFPFQVEETSERWERPLKYSFVEHAERNAIFEAARLGIALDGATMYACWAACNDCARAIIQSGIKEVVSHKTPYHEGSKQWQESIAIALTMFKEAGVKFRTVEGILGIEIRFNGKDVIV